jgi:hypothetical protein
MLLQKKEMEMEVELTNRELGRMIEDLTARVRGLLSFVDESGEVKEKEKFANQANALRELLVKPVFEEATNE